MNTFQKLSSFSSNERRGILVLFFLIAIALSAPYIIGLFANNQESDRDIKLTNEIKAFEKQKLQTIERSKPNPKAICPVKLQPFDPNSCNMEQLAAMGVNAKIASNISHYTAKGGHFFKKDDLRKIYGMSDSMYIILEPYINIQSSKHIVFNSANYKHVNKKITPKIELNMADSISLIALPGIGPVTASKILKYRRTLGGFYSVQQLFEIYKIDSIAISKAMSDLFIDTSKIQPLNLKTIDYQQLNRHPYISSYEAKAILNFRRLSSSDITADALLQNKVISNDTYSKIWHYLK